MRGAAGVPELRLPGRGQGGLQGRESEVVELERLVQDDAVRGEPPAGGPAPGDEQQPTQIGELDALLAVSRGDLRAKALESRRLAERLGQQEGFAAGLELMAGEQHEALDAHSRT